MTNYFQAVSYLYGKNQTTKIVLKVWQSGSEPPKEQPVLWQYICDSQGSYGAFQGIYFNTADLSYVDTIWQSENYSYFFKARKEVRGRGRAAERRVWAYKQTFILRSILVIQGICLFVFSQQSFDYVKSVASYL